MVNWWRVSRPWKLVLKFWFLTQNDENVLLYSHQPSSMKHHLTETHEQNFEIHNIVLSSQSVYLRSKYGNEQRWKWTKNLSCTINGVGVVDVSRSVHMLVAHHRQVRWLAGWSGDRGKVVGVWERGGLCRDTSIPVVSIAERGSVWGRLVNGQVDWVVGAGKGVPGRCDGQGGDRSPAV